MLLACSIVLLVMAPTIAQADWARGLRTAPPSGTTVPTSVSTNAFYEYFFHIAAAASASSSWLQIPFNVNVDICLDNDVADPATGTSTLAVQILHIPYLTGGSPANTNYATPLLGVTLNGVASTSGTTNDCIYDVKGPMWIQVAITATDADQAGLVSVAHRDY